MTYLHSDLINENNLYTYQNDTITILSNCNNNICSCVDVYPKLDYIRSNVYTCNSDNIVSIPYNTFTSNEMYRIDYVLILLMLCIFAFWIIFIPLKILFRFFRRFDF